MLKAPNVPSVLVGFGYVTNRADLNRWSRPNGATSTADSIVQAVDTFFSTRLAGAGQN